MNSGIPAAGARGNWRSADPLKTAPPHLPWCAVPARLAQVPLALKNARKPTRTRSTSARKSAPAYPRRR